MSIVHYAKLWPSADAYIESGFLAGTNFGSAVTLRANDPGTETRRSVIKFSLADIPSNATIQSATFGLFSETDSGGIDFDLYRLVRDWVEDEATWNEASSGVSWGTAGAANTSTDYDSGTNYGPITAAVIDTQATVSISTTLISNWLDGTWANYGLRISTSNTGSPKFHSSEATPAAYWPTLELTYTIPGISYSLNSGAITAGIQALWQPMLSNETALSKPNYNDNWYRHIWTMPYIDVSTFETIYALRHTALTEITTTDQTNKNVEASYATAKVLGVTGQQIANRMTNVRIEFLIDTSS